jgi:AraC-like DNA-binding protein
MAELQTVRPNRIEIWRPNAFRAVELHHGHDVTVDYPRHWHEEIYLCTVLKGASYLESRGTTTLSVPRQALAVVPPGEVHANRKTQCSFRCIFIEAKALQGEVERFMERSISGCDLRSGLITDAETTASFLRLHRSLENPGSEPGQDHSLLTFLHQLVARHGANRIPVPRQGNEDLGVRRAKRFLDEHYAAPILLRDLAQLTGLSPYHLNRSFCRRIGMPPHAYQLQVRLTQAKSYLQQGRTLAETASLVGFVDQSHFTHHFKRSVGMTPRQYLRYRKNLQDRMTHTEYF